MDTYPKPNFEQAFSDALSENRDRTPRDVLWASDLSAHTDGGCERQLFHKLAGDERTDNTVSELMMFRFGNRIHDDIADMLSDHLGDGWQVTGVESYGNDVYGLVSRSDMILLSPDDDRVVIEVKTSRGRAFSYRNGPEDLRDSHVIQLQAGITAQDADYGILLYIDREGSNSPDSYPIERDDETVMETVENLSELIEPAERYAIAKRAVEAGFLTEDEIPDPPAPLEPEITRNENKGPDSIEIDEPWNCGYCSFRNVVCPGAVPDDVISEKHRGTVLLKDHGEGGYTIYNDKMDDDNLPDLVDLIQ